MTRIFAKQRKPISGALGQLAVALSIAASIFYGVATIPDTMMIGSLPLVVLLKGLPVGLLAVFALLKISRTDVALLALGLVAHTAGDVFITGLLPGYPGDAGLMPAIISFGIGHLLYIIIFVTNFASLEKITFLRIQIAALLAAFAAFGLYWFWPQVTTQPLLIQVYAGTILVMGLLAVVSRYPILMVASGSLLFIISDALLGSGMFLDVSHGLEWAVWPTYYIGQFLIALGVILTPRFVESRGGYRFV